MQQINPIIMRDRSRVLRARHNFARYCACVMSLVLVNAGVILSSIAQPVPAPPISGQPSSIVHPAHVLSVTSFSNTVLDGAQVSNTRKAIAVPVRRVMSGSIVAVSLAQDNPFNALVGKKRVNRRKDRAVPKVQRYVLPDGKRSFLFQDRGSRARIQFLCGKNDVRIDCQMDDDGTVGFGPAEIQTLLPIRAPRGDVIFKDLQGDTVLRIASYGGATVWWPGAIDGQAASRSYAEQKVLELPRGSEDLVKQRALRATAVLSAMTGAPIEFRTGIRTPDNRNRKKPTAKLSESGEITPASGSVSSLRNVDRSATTSRDAANAEADIAGIRAPLPEEQVRPRDPMIDLLADTVVVTAKGVARVASDSTGARVLASRLKRIDFQVAKKSDLALRKKVLIVRFDPSAGLQGRPSSAQITRFLEENL